MMEGLYRGVVKDNEDPERLGRIRVVVPQVTGEIVLDWIWPCFSVMAFKVPYDQRLPSLNQGVWVMYEGGDMDKPVWMGVF